MHGVASISTLTEVGRAVEDSIVPAATEVELMGVDRAPVVVSSPRSRGARAYTALWAELRERLAI